jgi:NAD(P)-dependent dehydrogenase (short-subunit alcohol dehydrogenase family)
MARRAFWSTMQRFDDRHELLDMSEEYWDANQAINLRPVAFTAQAVAPGMIAAGGGNRQFHLHLLHAQHRRDAGLHRRQGRYCRPDQGARRAARPDGISVNAIAPGWVMTERQKELWVTEEGLADARPAVHQTRHRTR